jgi:hypothetical protein
MSILNIVSGLAGTTSVKPALAYIETSDTETQILTPGYLNQSVQSGLVTFSLPCMACVSTISAPGAQPLAGWYDVSYTTTAGSPVSGIWSLVIPVSDGGVILPTIPGDFAIFSDVNGTLEDLHYSPTNAALTKVVMQSGASVVGDIPKYNDVTGTLIDSGITAASISALLAGSGGGGSVRSATFASSFPTATTVVSDPAISASSVVIARFVSSANVVTVQTVLPAAGQFTITTDTAPSTGVVEYLSFTPSASLINAGVVVGKGSYGGGSATFVIADANITAGMVVTTNFQSQGTPSKVYTATCGAGTITFVCSANPGVCVIEYAAMLPGDISALALHAANYSYAGGFASIVISDASITAQSIVTAEFKSQSVVALIQKVTPSAGTLTILASIDPGPSVVAYIATASAGGGSGLSNALPSGDILVGNASNIATPVAMSGAATISNTGVVSLAPAYLQYVAVPITAAQFNGMYAAPVQLVAAGGANTLIVVKQIQLLMTYGSAAFAGGGVAAAQWDSTANGAGVIATTTLSAATFTPVVSTGFNFNSGVVPETFSTCVNKGLYLSNITQAFTTGTGSSFVAHVWYAVVPTV